MVILCRLSLLSMPVSGRADGNCCVNTAVDRGRHNCTNYRSTRWRRRRTTDCGRSKTAAKLPPPWRRDHYCADSRPPPPPVLFTIPTQPYAFPRSPRFIRLSTPLISRFVMSCYARRSVPLPRVVRNVEVAYNQRRNYFHADGNCWATPCFTVCNASGLCNRLIVRDFIVENRKWRLTIPGPKFELLSMLYAVSMLAPNQNKNTTCPTFILFKIINSNWQN